MMLLHAFYALTVPLLARAADHPVMVGGTGDAALVFDPEWVDAAAGDTIVFTFRQKNHTATQSSFAQPCAAAAGGYDSGFFPVPDTQTSDFPVSRLTINDTNPLWLYCKQGEHCRAGMVFAVNPGDRFTSWKAAAIAGTSPSGSASASASAPAPSASSPVGSDHKVVVGGPGKLLFDPDHITARAGDTVTFEFRQKNHTATQSTFANPCTPGGFDSGFRPVADSETANFPTYTIRVNDTKPIWTYCKPHCQAGMVFSVNAEQSGTNTFEAFRAKAMGSAVPSPSASSTPNNSAMGLNGPWWIAVVGVGLGALFL